MSKDGNGEVEIDVVVRRTTKMAVLVSHDGKTETWVPISVIADYDSDSGELDLTTRSIFLPQWIAEQKGLV